MPFLAFLFFLFPTMRKHKFLTKEILDDFRKIWSQWETNDPIVVCKFFDPYSRRTRFATEYDEENHICFGFVVGVEDERGYFSLHELEAYEWPFGIGIERDAHFQKCTFSELKEKEGL